MPVMPGTTRIQYIGTTCSKAGSLLARTKATWVHAPPPVVMGWAMIQRLSMV
jgi:hypothetical protein